MIQAVKDKLATGAPVLVVDPDHASPSLVEFLGRLPIDAVWIDCERGAGRDGAHDRAGARLERHCAALRLAA